MDNNLTAVQSIEISVSASYVWDTITNSDKIKLFLFGTNTKTDWKTGNPISFAGEMNGVTYNDKGVVLENTHNTLLRYSYWSSFSGLDDIPENYSLVEYRIEEMPEGKVKFTWYQQGFASEDNKCHTQDALGAMLQKIKEIAEGKK